MVQLAGTHYAGTIHTHLTELLQEHDGIDLSRPTVRRILANAGIGSPRSSRRNSIGCAAGGCPRRGCSCRSTAAITIGSGRKGPSLHCC